MSHFLQDAIQLSHFLGLAENSLQVLLSSVQSFDGFRKENFLHIFIIVQY